MKDDVSVNSQDKAYQSLKMGAVKMASLLVLSRYSSPSLVMAMYLH